MNLDTPAGEAMIEAGAVEIREHVHGGMDECSLCAEATTRCLSAALSVTVECAACGGGGKVRQLRGRAPAVEIHPCAACEGTGRRLAIKEMLDE